MKGWETFGFISTNYMKWKILTIIFLFLSDLIGMGNSDPLPLQGRDILIYLIHSFDIHLFIYSCVCFLGFVSDLSYQKRNKDG